MGLKQQMKEEKKDGIRWEYNRHRAVRLGSQDVL